MIMQDSKLEGLTLHSWTLQIWRDYRRGVALTRQQAAISHCLQNHPEWWGDLDTTDRPHDERAITNRPIHIPKDAASRSQGERENPKGIKTQYATLVGK